MENYDQYFRRVDSLAAVPRNSQSSYQFNSQYPANLVGGRLIQDLSVTNAKIQDLSVTNAKISDMSADKITAGTLSVLAQLGETSDASRIDLDGGNTRIVLYEDLSGTPNPIVVLEV